MRVSLLYDDDLSVAQRRLVRSATLGPLLRRAGDELGVGARHGLALRLCGDAALHALNRDFRGVDAPTDVLAFPGDGAHVGDIALSVERAAAQAAAADADPVDELRLLAVHGLLHCLGHDHAEPGEARRMTEATRRLLPGQTVPELVTH